MRSSLALKQADYYSNSLSAPPTYNPGDLVLLVNPRIRLSKLDTNFVSGPFIVISRNLNSYKIRHSITNISHVRNGRFLRPLFLNDADKKAVSEQNIALKANNTIAPLNRSRTPPLAENLDINIEDIPPESSNRYNLRPRRPK